MKILENITGGYKKIATGIAIVSILALMYIALIPGGTLAAVYNAQGVGIGGALVKLSDYQQYNNTTSDGTDGRQLGQYAIQEVPYGSYFMMTTHPDYAPNITSINVTSANMNKDIILKVCGNVFSDVSCNDWFYMYVMHLYDNGVTSGYPDGTYKPNNQISRVEVVTLIVTARNLTYRGGLTDFSDVPPTHWAYNYVMAAKQNGITSGYPDGTFKPNNFITRAETSSMLTIARSWTYSGHDVDFTDLPPTHWSYPYVMAVKERKIVGGYPDGTFKPDNQVSRAETSAMVTGMMLWY